MKYYSALKSKEMQPLVIVWMNLEDITLNEIGQTQKDKYMTSLTKSKDVRLIDQRVARWSRGWVGEMGRAGAKATKLRLLGGASLRSHVQHNGGQVNCFKGKIPAQVVQQRALCAPGCLQGLP